MDDLSRVLAHIEHASSQRAPVSECPYRVTGDGKRLTMQPAGGGWVSDEEVSSVRVWPK